MPRNKTAPLAGAAAPVKMVEAPKAGAVVPAKTPYNPIHHLGEYAHPPKRKGRKK